MIRPNGFAAARGSLVILCAVACGPAREAAPPVKPEPVKNEPPRECGEVTFCFAEDGDVPPRQACGPRCREQGGPSCQALPAALVGQSCEPDGGGNGYFMTCVCAEDR